MDHQNSSSGNTAHVFSFQYILIACFIALLASIMTLFQLKDYGIVWDEPIYFAQADAYTSWLLKPRWSNKDGFFAVKAEYDSHPPLRKWIGGITKYIVTDRLKILDNTRGYRVSSLLFVFPFVFCLTLAAIEIGGLVAGIIGSILFVFLPHNVFLAPLLTLDYAVAALWFITLITLWWGVKHRTLLLVSGITIGLSLLTKLYGIFLYIPVGIFLGITHEIPKIGAPFFLKKIWYLCVVFIVIPLVLYIGVWPWLWSDPIHKILFYLSMQAGHGNVPVYIFGRMFVDAPWYYVPVTFLVSTPVWVLILFGYGSFRVFQQSSFFGKWAFFNGIFAILFFTIPGVPRYDGVRLFLYVYPFIYLVVTYAMADIVRRYGRSSIQKLLLTIMIIICSIATIYISVVRIHPFESSYYNEVVGGLDGANRLGFEVEYWGNAYKKIVPWMNTNKKHMMCVYPMTSPFYYYQAMGIIEPGVVFNAGPGACEYSIVLMRRGLFGRAPDIEKLVNTQKPFYTYMVSHTPLIQVYKLPIHRETESSTSGSLEEESKL